MRAPIALTLCAALGAAAPARAEEPDRGRTTQPASDDARGERAGVITSEHGWIEILPEAPPPGTTIRLPEGWIRVESAPPDETPGSGSFGVIASEALAQRPPPGIRTEPQPGLRAGPSYRERAAPPRAAPEDAPAARNRAAAEALGPCYEEREAYVRELFRIAGLERVDRPLALLEGLAATPGLSPWVRFNLFGIPSGGLPSGPGVTWIDPVRPLAWDDGLRWVAKDLEACMRRRLGFDDRLVDPDRERRAERERVVPGAGERPARPPRGGTL